MHNPYASPAAGPPSPTQAAMQRWSTHRARVRWLGSWNLFCGVLGLLFTVFVWFLGGNLGPLFLLWVLFWSARIAAGAGMLLRRTWGRWLGVLVHILLCLSGVASVVGGFGLWVLLSDGGQQVFDPRVPISELPPKHRPSFVALFTLLVLANWAVPLWLLIFVLGPMV